MPGVPIEIRNLSCRYGDHTVVHDVSIKVSSGEFVALLGPSGSGKTTLLMAVAGFSSPSRGMIRIADRDVTRLPARERNIGMVFQKYALFPHMTVGQNIAFPLVQRGIGRDEAARRLRQITELVGLRGLEDRPVPQLSGGQQQRVALARALVYQPPVLLMDEPLGALDKKLRDRLQVEIKDIQRETGTTVVFVTHDQAEALSMADRLVVLDKGRIEQTGTPEELYEAPASAFVADFIGDANVLSGRLSQRSERDCRIEIGPDLAVDGLLVGRGDAVEVGSPVTLMLRPHAVRLDATRTEPTLLGRVLSTAYSGETVSTRLQLGNVVLEAKESRVRRRQPGEICAVSWRREDARVYPRA